MYIAEMIIEGSKNRKQERLDRESFEIRLELEEACNLPLFFMSEGKTIKIW